MERFQLPSISREPTIYIDELAGTRLVTWKVARMPEASQAPGVTVGLAVVVVVVVVARIVVDSLLVVVGTEVEDREKISMDVEDEVKASVLVKEEVSVVDAEDEVEAVVLTEVVDVVEDETAAEIAPWHSKAGMGVRSVTTHPCG